MRQWGAWILVVALGLFAGYQRAALEQLDRAEQHQAEAIGARMELVRATAGQHISEAAPAADQAMEGLAASLEELERVASAFEDALPSLEPKPGGGRFTRSGL